MKGKASQGNMWHAIRDDILLGQKLETEPVNGKHGAKDLHTKKFDPPASTFWNSSLLSKENFLELQQSLPFVFPFEDSD
jgi:hypothetical protein